MKISQRRESEGVWNAELLLVSPYGVRTWYPPGTDLGKHAWNTASQERSPQLKYPLLLLGLHSIVLTDHLISTWFNSLSRASGTCYSNLTLVPIIWLVFLLWLASNLRLASMARPCPKSKDISIRYDIDYLPQTQCKDQIYFLGCVCVCVHVHTLSCVQLFAAPQAIACQASLYMRYSRQEYWSGLPFAPPRDLPNRRTEPSSPASPALAGRLFTTEPPGKPISP